MRRLRNGEVERLEENLPAVRKMKLGILREFRRGTPGIVDGVVETGAGYDTDILFKNIIKDLLIGTEDLLGTSLLLEAQGDIKDASAILVKRADLLRLITDIILRQKELQQRGGETDYNSPAFRLFQKLCFEKLIEALETLNVDNALSSMILKEWQKGMADWDRELRRMVKEQEQEAAENGVQ